MNGFPHVVELNPIQMPKNTVAVVENGHHFLNVTSVGTKFRKGYMIKGRLLTRYMDSLTIICKECNAGINERCMDNDRVGSRLLTNSGVSLIHCTRAEDCKIMRKSKVRIKNTDPQVKY